MAITRHTDFAPGDRYRYDLRLCNNGWAQVDTRQDASYYGTWTNPTLRQIFNYCEGDTSLTACDSDAEYVQAIGELVEWSRGAGHWIGIDPGFDVAMRERFTALGLAGFLHG